MEGLEGRWASIRKPALRLLHALNRNSRQGSRKNIAAHYDLGNDFFSTFLDPTMMYSCAIFEKPETGLHEASIAKIDRICRKLDLQPSDHLLEIGTGWGGFALHAAKVYGCQVTTTTISRNQYDIAVSRIRQAGLENRITVLLKDYRDLEGTYDKLVSIEMIEAVGHQYLDQYMNKCAELLKENGSMLIQAITINDWIYEKSLRTPDFIKRYIFPGSFIPSISAITHSMKKATDLRLFHLEDITPHYAETLARWRDAFHQNIQTIRAQGFNRVFERMWEWYLCYCEGGFEERALGCAQLLFTKPFSRRAPILPSLG
jgi:cyclopropane-fatty-acyl-phospholipid synthase